MFLSKSDSFRKLRILIADDDRVISIGLQLALEELGHEVVGWAATGEGAIELASQQRPNVVFMDISLEEDLSGIDAAMVIREDLSIPSVFFSGSSDERTRRDAAAAEPLAFVDKLITQEELARLLRRLTESGQLG